MKFLARWAFRLLLLFIVLVVAAVLLLDTVAKALLEKSITSRTGLAARIGRVEIGLLQPKFRLEDLTLHHGAEFGGGPMLTMPELHVEYDFEALRERVLRLRLLRLNVGEVHEVINAAGVSSFTSLERQAQSAAGTNQVSASDSGLEFGGIDTLNLSFGKFKRTDLGRGGPARESSLNLNNLVVTNIRSAEDARNKLLPVLVRGGAQLFSDGFFTAPEKPAPAAR